MSAGEQVAAQVLVWLSDPAAVEGRTTGGKAANLARLLGAGFAVPPGFVISAEAVRRYHQRVAPWLEAELARTAPPTAEALASRAAQALLQDPLDAEIAEAALHGYRALLARAGSPVAVAVRSSALSEDLAGASFAGQHESVLGVRTEHELAGAIRRCAASVWSAHAVSYRAATGNREAFPSIAVIVQAQVPAEVSGVIFTSNPLAGRPDELVVTASYGLGEAIVSGQVTPDTFIADRDLRVKDRRLGDKRVMTVDGPAGTAGQPVPEEWRSRYCLSDADVRRVFELGRLIEAHYGSPQDIEWAIAGGELYVLQSRPITGPSGTRTAPPFRLNRVQRMFVEHSPMLANFSDHFPEPLTALDFTTTVRAALIGIGALAAYAGLRMRPPERLVPALPDGLLAFEPSPPVPTLRLLKLPWQLVKAWRMDVRSEWCERDLAFIRQADRSVGDVDLERATTGTLTATTVRFQEFFDKAAQTRFQNYFISGPLHGARVRLLNRIAGGDNPAERLRRLYLGVPHHTAQVNRALNKLVVSARGQPHVAAVFDSLPADIRSGLEGTPEAAAFMAEFRSFLDQYGSRSARGMVPVVSQPKWSEAPEVVLGMIASLLRRPSAEACPSGDAAHTAAVVDVRLRLARGWRGRFGLDRMLLASLERSRFYLFVREESLHECEVRIAQARKVALELGSRGVQAGLFEDASDVFHLRIEELPAAFSGELPPETVARCVAVRKRQYRSWCASATRGQNWARKAIGLPERPVTHRPGGPLLKGLAASPGSAGGSVRLLLSQNDFHKLRPGEVLVCTATSPAWTPLFGIAAAVVTDVGGPLSHAAIVAREYGIPAVLGTGAATRRLTDGMEVHVDGSAGVVMEGAANPRGSRPRT